MFMNCQNNLWGIMSFWETLLVAACGGGVVALINQLFMYFSAKREYRNQAFEGIIERKIIAYESLLELRGSVDNWVGEGSHKRPLLFDSKANFVQWGRTLAEQITSRAWLLDQETLEKARQFYKWYTDELELLRKDKSYNELDDDFIRLAGEQMFVEFPKRYLEVLSIAENYLRRELHKWPKRSQK